MVGHLTVHRGPGGGFLVFLKRVSLTTLLPGRQFGASGRYGLLCFSMFVVGRFKLVDRGLQACIQNDAALGFVLHSRS